MSVVKRGNKVCVVHGHKKKKGSKRDKPKGTAIKCYPRTQKGYAKAHGMHAAITRKQK